MKIFSCPSCGEISYFENSLCVHCGMGLAFSPNDKALVASEGRKRCQNFETADCNWLAASEQVPFCVCCGLNRTIPNQGDDQAARGWRTIEAAKRRLVYELLDLGLPVKSKAESPTGLTFDLLMPQESAPVITGHADGIITLNVKEAQSPFREEVRIRLGEPYRTLLGHLRHEVGHYYWDLLVGPQPDRLSAFRDLFGDETADYSNAMSVHYEQGPAADWAERCVSAYASMHPWEDWAETWAHYLHMVDAVDTGQAHGVQLRARKDPQTGADTNKLTLPTAGGDGFGRMLAYWYPLTFALNGLNRSMGHPDWYPFVLPGQAIAKLRFVDTVARAAVTSRA